MKLFEEAIADQKAGRLDDAVNRYRQVIAADPLHHQACHLLALLLLQRGDTDGACALLQQAIFAMPSIAHYRANFGVLLETMGLHSEAEAQFSYAVALNPGDADLHNRMGKCLFARQAYAPAKEAFYRALEIEPEFDGALNNLAVTLTLLEENKEAISCLEQLVDKNPSHHTAWANLALIKLLREEERPADALPLVERGLTQFSDRETVESLLRAHAEITRDAGDFALSKASFHKLSLLNPDDLNLRAEAELACSLATATDYYTLGDIPRAQSTGIKRVALFAPASSAYLNMLWGMKRAFERAGKQCVIAWALLPPPALKSFIDEFSPDLIVEINRTRDQAKVIPPHVKHIAWIQDGTLSFDQDACLFGGSERIYFMVAPEVLGYPSELLQQEQHYGLLPPAADPDIFRPASQTEFRYDCLFAAYIPEPLPSDLRITLIRDQEPWHLLPHEMEDLLRAAGIFQWSVGDCAYTSIHQHLSAHLNLACDALEIPSLSYRFIGGIMRLMDRKGLVENALSITHAVRLHGPSTWQSWPHFAPYYGGMLHDAKALASSYSSSRLIIHNGVSAVHPRTFEALACGGALMINRCYSDDHKVNIKNYLTAGEHYIEYALPEAGSAIRSALASNKLDAIRKAGRAVLLQGHTWDHRIKQILAEI